MKSFKDKVAVVTGAGGSGIGRALALALAAEGAKLAISDVKEETLDETISMLKAMNATVDAHAFDVADRAAMYRFADAVADKYGQVDLVINNAGVALGRVTAMDVDYDDFDWIMGINFWGMVYGSKAFLPHLVKRTEATLVNVSSLFGLMGVAYQVPYCTSKFAIRGFTESLRMEMMALSPQVTVTSVHPGGIKTNIVKSSRWNPNIPKEDRERDQKNFEKLFITTPETAAKVIIKGIKKKRPRVLIGRDAKFPDKIIRLFPGLYTKIIGRVMQRMERKGRK